MVIDILTLFPAMFDAIKNESIVGRAVKEGILQLNTVNIRDFTLDKHKKTDDYPFGGGAGMVLSVEPIDRAIEALEAKPAKMVYMSPRGKRLDKAMIDSYSQLDSLLVLCGHYEGVDERVLEHFSMEEVSVGDYIVTGGELPAMLLVDSVARLIPGVLGSDDAHTEESIYSGLLEYPQYTKPREYKGMEVPEVLYSGNHEKIHLWQFEKSLELTAGRRPDLFCDFLAKPASFSKKERALIDKVAGDHGLNDYNSITKKR